MLFFLLFLSIPLVFSATPKCPHGFPLHFERKPTATNNYTKDWCIAVVEYEGMGNRDRARSICITINATLTMPENKEEFIAIAKHVQARNKSTPHAIDGEFSPRCKAEMYRNQEFNGTAEKGECNVHNHLFNFDDVNTDPTFILSHFTGGVPNARGSNYGTGHPTFQYVADCLVLENTKSPNYTAPIGVTDLAYCVGAASVDGCINVPGGISRN
ncbi:unnamed protein product [Caenorhabditis brenneri]